MPMIQPKAIYIAVVNVWRMSLQKLTSDFLIFLTGWDKLPLLFSIPKKFIFDYQAIVTFSTTIIISSKASSSYLPMSLEISFFSLNLSYRMQRSLTQKKFVRRIGIYIIIVISPYSIRNTLQKSLINISFKQDPRNFPLRYFCYFYIFFSISN